MNVSRMWGRRGGEKKDGGGGRFCVIFRFFFHNQDFYTLGHESLITHAQLLQELERFKTTKSVHAHIKIKKT